MKTFSQNGRIINIIISGFKNIIKNYYDYEYSSDRKQSSDSKANASRMPLMLASSDYEADS